jgi:hypothetical protein
MSRKQHSSSIVWNYLYKFGPTRPRDLSDRLEISRMGVYQALQRLEGMGLVCRSGDKAWWRVYSVAPGAPPPNDLRGHALGSRRALAKRHSSRPRPASTCALAECWRVAAVPNGMAD